MSFVLTVIERSTTCLDLLPILQRIPLQKVKQFVLDEYNELDTVKQNKLRLEMMSLNHILPQELIQHILSFEYSSQSKPVCALWNKLSIQSDHIRRRNQILSNEIATFDANLTNAVNLEVQVRENTGWEQHWSKALLLQYKHILNSDEVWDNIDEEYRKKIVKSKHEWRVDKHTTFGMIRRKLGLYYGINPHHVEIWLPHHIHNWDYGSKGRGKWNAKLDSIVGLRPEYKQLCPLKFEIQPFNVKDFDQMTVYHEFLSNRDAIQFDKRIMDLAMFGLEFYDNNGFHKNNNQNQMTISYCKDWCAKDIIEHVLYEMVQNPVFGYTFLGNVIKYIKKYEMNDALNNDLLILQSLMPHRFLVIEDGFLKRNDFTIPVDLYMKSRYKMPDTHSQIKYTDFKVFFLATNDPLVLEFEAQPITKEDKNEMEVAPPYTKALWVFFRRSSKRLGLIRCVLTKGETLKHLILTRCLQYLKTPKRLENKIDCIMETHRFELRRSGGKNKQLKKIDIESEKIFDDLDSKMCLHVFMLWDENDDV
eukprot:143416_1